LWNTQWRSCYRGVFSGKSHFDCDHAAIPAVAGFHYRSDGETALNAIDLGVFVEEAEKC
jgi:hypothetical protein